MQVKLVAYTLAAKVLGNDGARRLYRVLSNLAWLYRNPRSRLRLRKDHVRLDDLNRYEARYCSQNGEDGITSAILRVIGTTNRFCVEIGAEDGMRCCTAYLVKYLGWTFVWLDSNPPAGTRVKREWVTADNINGILSKYGAPEEFDVLSIDVDYNTYWIWRAIEGFRPRLAIIEYNPNFPPPENKVVPYDPLAVWDGTDWYGASLTALTELGRAKGYRLVACDSRGTNAFFVREDLVADLSTPATEVAYRPPVWGVGAPGRHTRRPQPPSGRPFLVS